MKIFVRKALSFLLLLIPLWGCKKEDIKQATSPTNYLKFSDGNALKQAIAEISRAKDKQEAVQRIIGVYATGPADGNFHSLLANPKKNVAVYMHNAPATLQKGIKRGSQATARTSVGEELSDELVPDTKFAAVLSENLEVQVGEQLFMISPEGTFFTDAFNRDALALMVNDSTNTVVGTSIGLDTYNMGNGITRFDTYGIAETQRMAMEETLLDLTQTGGNTGGPLSTTASPCDIAQPTLGNFAPILPAQEYCNFPTYAYGAKTIVGGWLQNAFGVNTSRENELDYNHRVWVKVYDFNYWVYSSVGVKAGFQKKGFIFWGSMRSPKVVVGWDAFIIERPMVYMLANLAQPPVFPAGQIGTVATKELQKFKGFDAATNVISETSSDLVNKYSPYPVGKNSIEDGLRNMTGQGIASVSQHLWDYVNSVYAPGQVAFQNSLTTSFRMMFPEKTVVVLSRWEASDTNTEEINKVIDSNTCQITFSGVLGGSFKLYDNILKPTFDNKAYSYSITKVSAYGAAQYGGGWKGVRIIKE